MESSGTPTGDNNSQTAEDLAKNTTLFDALMQLQALCKMELDLKQTFGRLLDDQIEQVIKPNIKQHLQLQLKYWTDIEQFKVELTADKLELEIMQLKKEAEK